MNLDWRTSLSEWAHYFVLDNGRKPTLKEWKVYALTVTKNQLEATGSVGMFSPYAIVSCQWKSGRFAGDVEG